MHGESRPGEGEVSERLHAESLILLRHFHAVTSPHQRFEPTRLGAQLGFSAAETRVRVERLARLRYVETTPGGLALLTLEGVAFCERGERDRWSGPDPGGAMAR